MTATANHRVKKYASRLEYLLTLIVCHAGFSISFYFFNNLNMSGKNTFIVIAIAIFCLVYLVIMTERRLNQIGWNNLWTALLFIPLLGIPLQITLLFVTPKVEFKNKNSGTIIPTLLITAFIVLVVFITAIADYILPPTSHVFLKEYVVWVIASVTILFLLLSFRK